MQPPFALLSAFNGGRTLSVMIMCVLFRRSLQIALPIRYLGCDTNLVLVPRRAERLCPRAPVRALGSADIHAAPITCERSFSLRTWKAVGINDNGKWSL